jgi:hypothetical protein
VILELASGRWLVLHDPRKFGRVVLTADTAAVLERLREMRQREMIFIRDHYFFGGAVRVGAGYWVLTYVRRDSPLRFRLCDLTPPSWADTGTDLAQFFRNDPRALKMP